MARITVEDCLDYVENRFDLVLKAADRAHRLELGSADPMVDKDNDKPTVLALREIAAGFDVISVAEARDEDESPEEAASTQFKDGADAASGDTAANNDEAVA